MDNWIKVNPVLSNFFDHNKEISPLVLLALKHQHIETINIYPLQSPAWNEKHFDLDKVSLFKEASKDMRQTILWHCTNSILEEASFVEQLGLSFNAKMILLSDSLEEKILYSLFAADEAKHFYWINSHCIKPKAKTSRKPFFRLLSSIIENGKKTSLTSLIQVLLEGWGINHYMSIAKDCKHDGLKVYLKQILKDESFHHGSGIVLWNQQTLSSDEKAFTVEMLTHLFEMVQAGPQMVVKSIEKGFGHLSLSQKVRIFDELKCEEQSKRRLELLKSLISDSEKLSRTLTQYKLLRTYTAEECARYNAA